MRRCLTVAGNYLAGWHSAEQLLVIQLCTLLCPSLRHSLLQVKERRGVIERVQPDGTTAVCRGLFKKETDISVFLGLKVREALGGLWLAAVRPPARAALARRSWQAVEVGWRRAAPALTKVGLL